MNREVCEESATSWGLDNKTPTRRLSPKEKMKIHDELDFSARFTERYSDLFDQRLFSENEQLMEKSNGICSILTSLKHRGENLTHYTADQLLLETTREVAIYLKLLGAFSKRRMDLLNKDVENGGLVEGGSPPSDYTHWEEDQHSLDVMTLSINILLHEISPH